ncbi:PREDICTED: uncharacterized protein LOC105560170 [Vollenhovia emeryi]|uniref:uncharacterized protein LOC105560170 n=1 Tax=Vollenhovia emeryi TaxID=411798 RepID=UPI0005F47FAD|nr:PREDICTED: uncharacterized protein LOC105560170 [Vollenhovia emeryi]
MIRIGDQYLSVNKILLLTIGLWPYHQSTFTTFQYIIIFIILIGLIIFQLTTFLTLNCTTELFVKVLSSTSLFVVYIINYITFRCNIENVKDLLMHLQHIHNKLKDKNEIAIIKKYDYIAKCYTVILLTLGLSGIFVGVIIQYWTIIVVIALPANESRSYYLIFMMEYFIDQEKYLYLILMHLGVAVSVGMIIILGCNTTLLACIHHNCGLFRIASYRLEHAININIRQKITFENMILMTEGVIYAVDIHRQAIKLNKHLMSIFEIMLMCFLLCFVACLSLNLFQVIMSENIINVIIPIGCVLVCITFMFFCNFLGQIVTDHNNCVFTTAYNVQWYKTPLHIQRMILFLLQTGIKELYLNVGGVFDASIEGFATLIKASISYFTVIYSIQ